MLISLSIKNYALIDDLKVDFTSGFSIITGETGAGKSILLDGLSLALGKRADLSTLRNKDQKCVIEAVFAIQQYQLESFFEEHDLDYDGETFLRREILPSGKTRAFVNDSPVTLQVMDALGQRLTDIHSQHKTLQLAEHDFQFMVLDALSDVEGEMTQYQEALSAYRSLSQQLKELQHFSAEATKELDYNSFLLRELEEAKLEHIEQNTLEEEYETLNNVEDIRDQLTHAYQLLQNEQMGILANIQQVKLDLQRVSGFSEGLQNLASRIESVSIELDDIFDEIQQLESQLEADPQRLSQVNELLQTLYNLQKKHNADSVSELVKIASELEAKVAAAENVDDRINAVEKDLVAARERLDSLALSIHQKRIASIPKLSEQLESMLVKLGMENARFDVQVATTDHYYHNGKDTIDFLFSANKGGAFGPMKKVASGGELSRIMLCIKAILAKYAKLPSIIFDEIDTGVSGAVSEKMADIMVQMSHSMQVFAITHLPQVAAKGHQHYKVYKTDQGTTTVSHLKRLNNEERVVEIAQMLGGKDMTDSAMAHAKQLLN